MYFTGRVKTSLSPSLSLVVHKRGLRDGFGCAHKRGNEGSEGPVAGDTEE